MADISIYLNARASNSRAKEWRSEIEKRLFRHNLTFKSPNGLEELRNELQRDLANHTECVFSIGGDGTANVVIQELAGSDVKLLVVPAGTANDLAQNLGISQSINNIIKLFQHKTTSKIDLIKINDSYMATNGGVGLPTQVALDVNTYRQKLKGFRQLMSAIGPQIYSLFLAKLMLLGGLERRRIEVLSPDYDGPKEIETPMIMINNQPTLGGEFYIAPKTVNNDGKFNVTIFTHKDKMDLAKCVYQVRSKNIPKNDPQFIQFETQNIELISKDGKTLTFFGDGEILKESHHLKIGIFANGLSFFKAKSQNVYEVSYSLNDIATI